MKELYNYLRPRSSIVWILAILGIFTVVCYGLGILFIIGAIFCGIENKKNTKELKSFLESCENDG